MRLGLVYLPDPDAARGCVTLSRALVDSRAARVVLGEEARPHLTLLHVESNERPEQLWREAEEALPPTMRFDFLALGLLRYDTPYNSPPAPPATMAWIIVPCTARMREAEKLALGLPFVARSRVTTSNGDDFQPHLTVAIWEGTEGPVDLRWTRDFVSRRDVGGHLALGVIGSNGVYERTLFS